MRKLLVRIFLKLHRHLYVEDPLWTPTDAEQWQAFLQSSTGKKLDVILCNLSIENDRISTLERNNPTFAAGYACGFRAEWLIAKSLSAQPEPQSGLTTEEPADYAAGDSNQ